MSIEMSTKNVAMIGGGGVGGYLLGHGKLIWGAVGAGLVVLYLWWKSKPSAAVAAAGQMLSGTADYVGQPGAQNATQQWSGTPSASPIQLASVDQSGPTGFVPISVTSPSGDRLPSSDVGLGSVTGSMREGGSNIGIYTPPLLVADIQATAVDPGASRNRGSR